MTKYPHPRITETRQNMAKFISGFRGLEASIAPPSEFAYQLFGRMAIRLSRIWREPTAEQYAQWRDAGRRTLRRKRGLTNTGS